MDKFTSEAIAKQKHILKYYSPYNFVRNIDLELQFNAFIVKKIWSFLKGEHPTEFSFRVTKKNIEYTFLYQYLEWDTQFFKKKCYKLFTVLYSESNSAALTDAIGSFKNHLSDEHCYIFTDVPSEDIFLIQCLGLAGFKMVETRLHFFKDQVANYNAERYSVRNASREDVAKISEVARHNINGYDRIHADVDFSKQVADDYLGTYAKLAVEGYCDAVLVPAAPGVPVDSFLAINHLKEDGELLNDKFTRVALTAVGPANKGWHIKLVSETIYYAQALGASYVLMTTQSTNRAVFRTSEKLGFKLGGSSHILSYSN